MIVKLLSATPEPEKICIAAAKQCYDSGFVGDDYENLCVEENVGLLRKVLNLGHHSVLEHASFTFGIKGISRVTSHQLVRFRIAVFSQQSQRYCKVSDGVHIPEQIMESPFLSEVSEHTVATFKLYDDMVKSGIPKEDARYVLPAMTNTNIVMTMNARELYHACKLRCCNRAQWEIREMFNKIAAILKEKHPLLFSGLGPSCVNGICPEGGMGCGRVQQ